MKMNKIGMAKTPKAIMWTVIAMVALVVVIGAFSGWFSPVQQTVTGGVTGAGTGAATGAGTTIIATANTVNIAGQDAQQLGTAVTGTYKAAVLTSSGTYGSYSTITSGSSSYDSHPTLSILLTNNTNYHNALLNGQYLGTSDPIKILVNKNASVTENIYSTTGIVLDDGGNGASTANQTDLGNGVPYNFKDEMQGTSLASTQDMTCVLEITAKSNVTSSPNGLELSLNGQAIQANVNNQPNWYSVIGTGSKTYSYDVPALNSGATATFNIRVNTLSTGRITAGNYLVKSCYTKEHFIDSYTGLPMYAVADSQDNLKSMAKYSYTIGFI